MQSTAHSAGNRVGGLGRDLTCIVRQSWGTYTYSLEFCLGDDEDAVHRIDEGGVCEWPNQFCIISISKCEFKKYMYKSVL